MLRLFDAFSNCTYTAIDGLRAPIKGSDCLLVWSRPFKSISAQLKILNLESFRTLRFQAYPKETYGRSSSHPPCWKRHETVPTLAGREVWRRNIFWMLRTQIPCGHCHSPPARPWSRYPAAEDRPAVRAPVRYKICCMFTGMVKRIIQAHGREHVGFDRHQVRLDDSAFRLLLQFPKYICAAFKTMPVTFPPARATIGPRKNSVLSRFYTLPILSRSFPDPHISNNSSGATFSRSSTSKNPPLDPLTAPLLAIASLTKTST